MRFFKLLSILFFILLKNISFSQNTVTATIDTGNKTATMSNGIITITINSKGQVNTLTHNGTELLDAENGGRFYFSYNDQDSYKELSPTTISLKKLSDDYAEVVYTNNTGGIQIEQAFILRKDVSGLYNYITIKGTATTISLREMRVVYRVSPSLFTYGYVSDDMQGELPSVEVMKAVNDSPIMDATYQLPNGSVYTKYDWANYIVHDSVHGIMSASNGIWAIPVSNEYMNGGPMKQELTVHATNKTPLVLQMLQGEHFGASAQAYSTGDEKIYGPFFIYVNSGNSHHEMIDDAKAQASIQKQQWPFQWLEHSLYPTIRTKVNGKITLPNGFSSKGIQVILAQPGTAIYAQGKEYMFWTKTNADGIFSIDAVRPGNYSLYAYATEGEITDELHVDNIKVEGENCDLGEVTWMPKKYDNLLWIIGENNRMTSGFRYADTLRHYGSYNLPPANLTYTIGSSQTDTDWYYAQTKEGSWTISFDNNKALSGNAYLTASIAGASNSPTVSVYINGAIKSRWNFSNDASIYRSAVLGGRHTIMTSKFPASLIKTGQNTIRLSISDVGNRGGVMYDCIKLEAGSLVTGNEEFELAGIESFTSSIYPNPFTNSANITVRSEKPQPINVSIFNSTAQLVKTIYQGNIGHGETQFQWTPQDCNNGIYYYRIQSEDNTVTGKMIYIDN